MRRRRIFGDENGGFRGCIYRRIVGNIYIKYIMVHDDEGKGF